MPLLKNRVILKALGKWKIYLEEVFKEVNNSHVAIRIITEHVQTSFSRTVLHSVVGIVQLTKCIQVIGSYQR